MKDVLKTDVMANGFDFKKLANSCCLSECFHEVHWDGVRYQSDLKSGMGEIKCLRSSLSKYLRATVRSSLF